MKCFNLAYRSGAVSTTVCTHESDHRSVHLHKLLSRRGAADLGKCQTASRMPLEPASLGARLRSMVSTPPQGSASMQRQRLDDLPGGFPCTAFARTPTSRRRVRPGDARCVRLRSARRRRGQALPLPATACRPGAAREAAEHWAVFQSRTRLPIRRPNPSPSPQQIKPSARPARYYVRAVAIR